MKSALSKLLLVAAMIVPAHVFAETYADHSAGSSNQTRVIHYTHERPAYNRAYTTAPARMTPFYDREGYVYESKATIIQAMQQALRDAGFYKLGDVNGIWTQQTADALYSYQLANGLRGTARLDYETGRRLGMAMPAMDKVMEGSTRAPMANDTTLHARGMAGRRIIHDPAIVVEMSARTQDIQQALADAGFYKGRVDGIWGPQTGRALRSYQAANGLRATGMLNMQTVKRLGMAESDMSKDIPAIAPAAGR